MKKTGNICIIDDDPIFIYGTKRMMKEVGLSDPIIVHHNGQEAIDNLSDMVSRGESLPSVILLDLNMPIMNGWEFLENFIRIPLHHREQVKVYVVSSSIDPRDLEHIKNYDVVDTYILKPLSPLDLQNVIENVC